MVKNFGSGSRVVSFTPTHTHTNKYTEYPHRVCVRVHKHAQTVWLAVTPTHREAMAQLTSLL